MEIADNIIAGLIFSNILTVNHIKNISTAKTYFLLLHGVDLN